MKLFTQKRVFGYVAAALLLSGASCAPKNSYTVTTILSDTTANGKKVYLRDYNNEKAIDSTVVNNGKFTFTGTIQRDSLRRIDVDQTRLYANFILEPGNITINIDSTKHKMSGTPKNDVFAQIESESEKAGVTINALYEELKKDTTLTKEQFSELYEAGYKKAKDAYLTSLNGYAKQYPNTSLSAFAIWQIITIDEGTETFEKNKQMIEADTYAKDFTPIKNIIKAGEQLLKTAEGMPFTDFTIKGGSLTGEDVSLSDYVGKGKYILVDFWASWCGPCRGETPNIKNIYKKYKGDKFDILSVAVWDKKDETLKAIEEDQLPWNQIINAGSEPTELYGIKGIPHIILFGPDGTIVKRGLRGESMEKAIKEALEKK